MKNDKVFILPSYCVIGYESALIGIFMNRNHKPLCLTILRVCLGLAIIPVLPGFALAEPMVNISTLARLGSWKISQKFTPPDRGTPKTTAGGGTRGEGCPTGKKALTALIPKIKLGLTLSDRPTFYWFLPVATTNTGKFSLQDQKGNLIFEVPVHLPNKSGIMGFTPPEKMLNLQVGNQYHWFLTLPCDADHDIEEMEDIQTIEGWIEKVQDPKLSQKIAKTKPSQLSQVYADAGIWYEAIDNLIKQRCIAPEDKAVIANWQALLGSDSVGLTNVAGEPLLTSCAAKTN